MSTKGGVRETYLKLGKAVSLLTVHETGVTPEKVVEHSLTKATALRESILKKAFEGRLLTDLELSALRDHPHRQAVDSTLDQMRADYEVIESVRESK